MKLSDLLILSDVDGTLVDDPHPIPPRNIEALTRFTRAGGRFALATGRAIQSTARFVQQLPVNAPCILFNGAGLYDYSADRLLATHYLPDSAFDYIQMVTVRFPQAGVVLFNEQTMYSIANKRYSLRYFSNNEMLFSNHTPESARAARWFKAVFALPPNLMPELQAFIGEQGWSDVSVVGSSEYLYEILPLGISKKTGLLNLSEALQIPVRNIVAIGDYYNDEEMLRSAGFSATVADAPEDIKQLCGLVTGSCRDGALADLVEYLEGSFKALAE